jgi:protein gp37
MATSKIEWTGSTWNPITGCTKYSDGCTNCYAEKMANRLKNMGLKKYENSFNLTLHYENIEELEQLRAIDNGHKIAMIKVISKSFGIDTQEDLNNALKIFKK